MSSTTSKIETAPETADQRAPSPFNHVELKNADWETDGALDERVELIDNLRRVALMELTDRYGATMVGMDNLDRIASALGDAMRAIQAHEDAIRRYERALKAWGMCK